MIPLSPDAIQIQTPLLEVVKKIAAERKESVADVASNLIFSGLCWHDPIRPMGVRIDMKALADQLDALETEGGSI